jgi:RNA-directed DNA polymerase
VRNNLKDLWNKAKGGKVQAILSKLNPVIRGWANYFRIAVAKEIFGNLDSWMFHKADNYTKHTHRNKSKGWRQRKYWGRFNLERQDDWTFGDKQTGAYLLKFSWFPIERHTLVKGTASPDDPRLKDYWTKRQAAKGKDLTISKQKLAKRQKGRCPECGESLFNDEESQVHHLLARSRGGQHTYNNLALVHLLCHQHIHAKTERAMNDCQRYNDQEVLANDGKISRQSKHEEKREQCCS